jgi:hypothetical protein
MLPLKSNNLAKRFLRTVASLILKRPLAKYEMPEFFFDVGRRVRISYIAPLARYYLRVSKAIKFYDKHATKSLPEEKALVLFLHLQPEATSMPQGGVFADQLLVFDLILAALPEDMTIWVKEHPYMFYMSAQDMHERSVKFYQHLLKDPRVRFIDRTVSSRVILERGAIFASTNGTISWEAMRNGKPCIIFGWAWFAPCQSCFVVDSVETLKAAFAAASRKTRAEVLVDVQEFLCAYEKRVVHAVPWRYALDYVDSDFSYEKSVARLGRAIGATLGLPAAVTTPSQEPKRQAAVS